ncbi:MAG: hypothetical protein AAGC85_19210 [Bacteroidota bacterium]
MESKHFSKKQLVLEQNPFMGRILSYAVIGAGLILMFVHLNKPQKDFIFWAGMVIAIGGLISQLFLPESTQVIFDKVQDMVSIQKKKSFFRKKLETYKLSEIQSIRIEARKSDNPRGAYRIALSIDDGWVPLTSRFSQKDVKAFEGIAQQIQQILAVEEPS